MATDGWWMRLRQGTMLQWIIVVNVAVFVLVHLMSFVSMATGVWWLNLLVWLEMPTFLPLWLTHPWTIVTYMFTHYDVWHILFNMLWLYWMGRIFMEFFMPKQLMGLYVLSGLGGALLCLLCYNVLPGMMSQQGMLLGASGAVVGIAVAVAVYRPDYPVMLLLIGRIALKWVVIVTIVIDMVSIDGSNPGGHLAHLGGALVGLWFALAIKRGRDITRWFNAAVDSVVNLWPRRRTATIVQPPRSRREGPSVSEAEIDAVLDKIRRSGFNSLTERERQILARGMRR